MPVFLEKTDEYVNVKLIRLHGDVLALGDSICLFSSISREIF